MKTLSGSEASQKQTRVSAADRVIDQLSISCRLQIKAVKEFKGESYLPAVRLSVCLSLRPFA